MAAAMVGRGQGVAWAREEQVAEDCGGNGAKATHEITFHKIQTISCMNAGGHPVSVINFRAHFALSAQHMQHTWEAAAVVGLGAKAAGGQAKEGRVGMAEAGRPLAGHSPPESSVQHWAERW